MNRIAVTFLSMIAVVGVSWNAAAADAAKGEALAKRWCAACHIVASDQKAGGTQAPAFSSIAKNKGFDASRLALFLLDPHPKMPDMGLSRAAAADLAAYIKGQGQ